MDNVNIRVMGIFYLSSVVTRTFSRNGKKKVFHFSGFPLAYNNIVKMLLSVVRRTYIFLHFSSMVSYNHFLQFFIIFIHFIKLNYFLFFVKHFSSSQL